MHKGIRNYRPTPTASGTVCQASMRREGSSSNSAPTSQRNSPSRRGQISPTRQMLHHQIAPGAHSYDFREEQGVPGANNGASGAGSTARQRARSPTTGAAAAAPSPGSAARSHNRRHESPSLVLHANIQRRPSNGQHPSSSSTLSLPASSAPSARFDYEAEVAKLLAVPPVVSAPRGAPSFVIVAADSGGGAEVGVALAENFNAARAVASTYWKVPKYENLNAKAPAPAADAATAPAAAAAATPTKTKTKKRF